MATGKRSPDQRSVSFSCAKTLVAQIDELASREKRTRSNWIVKQLEQLVAERKVGATKIAAMPPPPQISQHNIANMASDSAKAAEEPGEYKTRRTKPKK